MNEKTMVASIIVKKKWLSGFFLIKPPGKTNSFTPSEAIPQLPFHKMISFFPAQYQINYWQFNNLKLINRPENLFKELVYENDKHIRKFANSASSLMTEVLSE